jgi:hypothetical protein
MKRRSKRIGRRERRIIFKRKQILSQQTNSVWERGRHSRRSSAVRLTNKNGRAVRWAVQADYKDVPKNGKDYKIPEISTESRSRPSDKCKDFHQNRWHKNGTKSSRMWLKQLYSYGIVIVLGLLASNLKFQVGEPSDWLTLLALTNKYLSNKSK